MNFNDYIAVYRAQMQKGHVPEAYRRLMTYIFGLKNHFQQQYPDGYHISDVHRGDMDVSFFTVTPVVLKREKLKIVVVFNHLEIRFEIWLAAQNKLLQKKYREIFKDSDWHKHPVSSSPKDGFSIVEALLVESPDFDDQKTLTGQIETRAMQFIGDITDIMV